MENLKVEYPEFQFKEFKVRVLTTISLDLATSLHRLVDMYNFRQQPIDNSMAVREFVIFVSCDLMYPIQVCSTNVSSNG